jgi:hypothetical protein
MHVTVAGERCLNCGAELQGAFCHACGQKASSAHLELHDVVHEATHEFLHLDGKIVNTLKVLIAKPGQLTKEFIEGRRARYISPIRVYLTCSLLFFFLAATLPGAEQRLVRVTTTDIEEMQAAGRTAADIEHQEEALRESVIHSLPRVMFVIVPVYGLLTFLFYRRRQPFYIAHFYFGVHVHAFGFLVRALALALNYRIVGVITGTWVLAYHYAALHRLYGESWPRTLLKGTAIALLYSVAAGGAVAALLIFTIRSVN